MPELMRMEQDSYSETPLQAFWDKFHEIEIRGLILRTTCSGGPLPSSGN